MKLFILFLSMLATLHTRGQDIPDLRFNSPDTIANGQYIPDFKINSSNSTDKTQLDNFRKTRFICHYFIGSDLVLLHYLHTDKIFYPDLASFEIINNPYDRYKTCFSKDKDHIYLLGEPISNDTGGFQILSSIRDKSDSITVVWKNNSGVYFNQYLTKIKDIKGFKKLEHGWLYNKDDQFLYYLHHPIENSHPSTAHIISSNYAYDSLNVYYQDKVFSYKEQSTYPVNSILIKTDNMVYYFNGYDFMEMKAIDVKSLMRLSDRYSMDKNFVYFDTFKLKINPKNINKIKTWDNYDQHYITDGQSLYDQNSLIKTPLDPKSFDILSNTNLIADKTGIYKWRYDNVSSNQSKLKRIPFRYQYPFNVSKVERLNHNFIQYKLQIYDLYKDTVYYNLDTQRIQTLLKRGSLDPKQVYITGIYTKKIRLQNNKVLFNNKPTSIDLKSLKVLDRFYLKDTHFVYRVNYHQEAALQRLAELDVNTFKVLQNGLFMDKNAIYHGNHRIISSQKLNILAYHENIDYRCGNDTSRSLSYYFYLMHNMDGYWLVRVTSDNVAIRFLGTELPDEMK